MTRRRVAQKVDEPLHQQDAAALARLRARLRLSPGERWELWVASMRGLEDWQGIAGKHLTSDTQPPARSAYTE